jgi:hypothetical protein
MASTSILDAEFTGTGTTSGFFDVLDVNGTANLAGTLDLIALAGFNPIAGESFDILNCSVACDGTFSSLLGTSLSGGDYFTVQYNANDVVATVNGPANGTTSPSPEPGTFFLIGLGLVGVPLYRKLRSKAPCA